MYHGAGDARALPDALEEQRHPILGQRGARLGEEEVILADAAPLGQLLLIGPAPVQVVQQVAQAVLTQRDAPHLGALALDREDAVLAVEVSQPETAEFGDADARVVEHPQDGPVAHGGALSHGSSLLGRSAGQQKTLELVGVDGLDQRLAHLGEGHAVERGARDALAAHQPVEEGPCRARIGLDGAFGSHLAAAGRRFAHVREPGVDVGGLDLADLFDASFFLEVAAHQPQGGAVPLQRLGAVVAALMVKQVVVDGSPDCGSGAAVA